MDSKSDGQDFEKTITGEDFDFDFDEDFETEVKSEYMVMDAMRFDREAGTASCNFEIDEDEDDAFRIPGATKTVNRVLPEPEPAAPEVAEVAEPAAKATKKKAAPKKTKK